RKQRQESYSEASSQLGRWVRDDRQSVSHFGFQNPPSGESAWFARADHVGIVEIGTDLVLLVRLILMFAPTRTKASSFAGPRGLCASSSSLRRALVAWACAIGL